MTVAPLRDDTSDDPLDAGEEVALRRQVHVDQGPVGHDPQGRFGVAVPHRERRDGVQQPENGVVGLLQGERLATDRTSAWSGIAPVRPTTSSQAVSSRPALRTGSPG